MPPTPTRRACLGTVGATLLGGLAGCTVFGSGSSAVPSGTTTYGFDVRNTIEPADFEQMDGMDAEPAVVHLRVADRAPDSDTVYFEQTVEVPTDTTETITDAFTAESEGPMISVTARLEPFVEGGLSRGSDRSDQFTFRQDDVNSPGVNPIPVIVQNHDRGEGSDILFPNIYISADPQ